MKRVAGEGRHTRWDYLRIQQYRQGNRFHRYCADQWKKELEPEPEDLNEYQRGSRFAIGETPTVQNTLL